MTSYYHSDDYERTAERLRLALDAGQLGDWSWDASSDVVELGQRGAEIFGLAQGQTIKWEQLRQRLHPNDRERAKQAVEQALANHSDYSIEYRVERPSGQVIWVAAQGRGVYGAKGEVLGMIGVVQDITHRKHADAIQVRLAAVVESSDDAIISKSLEGIIATWNTGAERMFGYSADEAIGQSILILIPNDRQHEEGVIISRLRRGERIEHYETERVRKDGSLLAVSLSVSPIKDATGEVIGASKIARDITQRKVAEELLRRSEAESRTLAETAAVLSSTLEIEVLLQAITDAATKLSGARFGAFFYNSIDDAGEAYLLYTLSGASREAFENFGHPRATPLLGPTFKGAGPIRSGDILADPRYAQMEPLRGIPEGNLPVRSYLAVPVASPSGGVVGALFFGHPDRDVFTERAERLVVGVASQAAVAIDNARLYDTVRRAAEEREALLNAERAARSDAERMNLMKDEFLATLSHELRTPLNAILGWSQLLRMDGGGGDDLEEGLEAIERNARTQTQLIEDLLDMSRIISGKIRLDVQWTDLANVVHAAVESIRPSAAAKEIPLRAIIDPLAGPVMGDPTRLQQIVWNLLSNAIKFTPKGGKVDVILERVNSHLEITVHDTGIGITPEFLPVIFERFRQADSSTTRSYGGLGLGLSIVKNLVDLHGGSIRAKSAGDGLGSTFIVSFPLAPIRRDEVCEHPKAQRSGPIDCETVLLAGVKVLVVDDEADARELIKRVLSQCHADVITASNAEEALTLVSQQRPDVLVSDIGMPGVDGYQLLRQLRRLPADQGGKTPAVALTAFARSEDRTRAMMAGYQVHIAKPIEAAELLATVGSLAGRTGGDENR